MAHVNTVTVQTAEGATEVTKTSTHRDYVVASVACYADGTQALFVWHLTREAGEKYTRTTAATKSATYNERHHGGSKFLGWELLPVTVTLTGKDKVATPAVSEEAVTEALNQAADKLLAQDDASEIRSTEGFCRCGCGLSTGKRQYRPGHDARHAGAVARDIASSSVSYFERVTADDDLGSQALIEKAHRQAERLIAKMQKAAAKEAK